MNKLLFPLIVFLVIISLYFSWTYIRTTPRYSLYMTYRSVINRDYSTFSKYVDVDATVDSFLARKLKVDSTKNDSENVLFQMKTALMNMLRKNLEPTAANAMKALVKKGVESGSLFALYKPYTVFTLLLGAQVSQDNDDATVAMQEDNGRTITVKMRKLQDHWQVYEFMLNEK